VGVLLATTVPLDVEVGEGKVRIDALGGSRLAGLDGLPGLFSSRGATGVS
jgi:hypothetical protein